jgi:hypothetical protein
MASNAQQACRITGCGHQALPNLTAESLCLDHFMDQTFARATQALELCQQAQPLNPSALEWLLADARIATQALVGEPDGHEPSQRERLLDLLLCLSNLQEYVRHHSVPLARPR